MRPSVRQVVDNAELLAALDPEFAAKAAAWTALQELAAVHGQSLVASSLSTWGEEILLLPLYGEDDPSADAQESLKGGLSALKAAYPQLAVTFRTMGEAF